MTSALSAIRLSIWPNIAEIRVSKETLRKGLIKLILLRLITSLMKFQK
jgi:hypothetical protein